MRLTENSFNADLLNTDEVCCKYRIGQVVTSVSEPSIIFMIFVYCVVDVISHVNMKSHQQNCYPKLKRKKDGGCAQCLKMDKMDAVPASFVSAVF